MTHEFGRPGDGSSWRRDDARGAAGAEQIWHELASGAGAGESGASPARLSELIRLAAPSTLAAAIGASQVHSQTKRVLNRALDVIDTAAVLALARASAAAFARPLSPGVDALLQKIVRGVEGMPAHSRAAAHGALRDLVRAMIEAWAGATVDFGAADYDVLFAEQPREKQERAWSSRLAVTPERVIATAFEVDALGAAVWNAVGQLGGSEDGVRQILEMVKHAPTDRNAVEVVAQQFATPVRLALLLRENPIDFSAVDAVVARLRDAAATSLIDALVESEQREVRTALLARIARLGPGVCTLAAERLQRDDRWFVQRNMLRVIREAACDADPALIDPYLQHADSRVREEAVQVLLANRLERDRVLTIALRDPEHSVLKIALKAARESAPEGVMPYIAKRIQEPGFPNELRMASIHVLARSTSVLALEPLLRFVVGGTTLLGKPKLAAKSPEMLVALDGIARMWSHERRAAAMLTLARESNDPEIIAAAEGRSFADQTPEQAD